jgi:hypothetical protein
LAATEQQLVTGQLPIIDPATEQLDEARRNWRDPVPGLTHWPRTSAAPTSRVRVSRVTTLSWAFSSAAPAMPWSSAFWICTGRDEGQALHDASW